MSVKLGVLLCALSAALAYPASPYYVPEAQDLLDFYEDSQGVDHSLIAEDVPVFRAKRQWQLQGGGGGSPGKGYGVGLQAAGPVWTSDNGRHIVGASGSYSQFLGGPYGSSKPNLGVGASYTFKF